jgi:DNA-binding transcriptional regulator/RsmH inhibitor MraZ
MIKLRPPDGRVFVTVDEKHKHQIDVTITAVGNGVDLEIGKKACVVGKMQKVELQDVEVYSVHVDNIAFLYE